MFSEFGINYNNEPEIFKKGTILVRDMSDVNLNEEGKELSKRQIEREEKKRRKAEILELHEDFIKDEFWQVKYPWILEKGIK